MSPGLDKNQATTGKSIDTSPQTNPQPTFLAAPDAKKPPPISQKRLSFFGVPRGIRPLRQSLHAPSCVGSPTLTAANILFALLTLSQRSLRFESPEQTVKIRKALPLA